MLLTWLGERRSDEKLLKAADLIERALDQTIAKPRRERPISAARSAPRRSASGLPRLSRGWRNRLRNSEPRPALKT
jgi:hypothetical protein